MTIYVDNAKIKAKVYNPWKDKTYDAVWFHLFSSRLNPRELLEFIDGIKYLKREYFQRGMRNGERWPPHDHIDITSFNRYKAIKAGAIPVEQDHAVELWRRKAILYQRWLETR